MKLQRLIAMLTALLQRERISASWFAEKFGVSVRTVYRDMEALESAGIPIVTHTGVNGGISIVEGYKIDKQLFTHQDIATLLTSLHSVSGSMSEAQINQTAEKIKSLIPQEYGQAVVLKSKQLLVDLTPWSSHAHISAGIHIVQKALESSSLLRFDYAGRQGEATLRIAEPHQLVLKENHWYLRAFCRQRQDFRTFKISRMSGTELLSEQFEPREFENGMTDFKNWKNEQMIIVELVIDPSLRERALDYCHEEQLRELEDGMLGLSLPFVESEMGYGVLLGMGHLCYVVSPVHVRAELLRRAELLLERYQSEGER